MVFLLLRVAPGDPISAALGAAYRPRSWLVVARPPATTGRSSSSTADYVCDVLGDFGMTVSDNRAVSTYLLLVNGAATLSLTVAAPSCSHWWWASRSACWPPATGTPGWTW